MDLPDFSKQRDLYNYISAIRLALNDRDEKGADIKRMIGYIKSDQYKDLLPVLFDKSVIEELDSLEASL